MNLWLSRSDVERISGRYPRVSVPVFVRGGPHEQDPHRAALRTGAPHAFSVTRRLCVVVLLAVVTVPTMFYPPVAPGAHTARFIYADKVG